MRVVRDLALKKEKTAVELVCLRMSIRRRRIASRIFRAGFFNAAAVPLVNA